MNERQQWNQAIIDEFRANGGKVGGNYAHMPLLLLTTTGAKSGEPRISPLAYAADGDRLLIAGGNGGRSVQPGWYYNLLANPLATVEVGTERFEARAHIAEGEERERLYARLAEALPVFATFQEKTTRQIPIIVLERAS